MYKTKLKAKLRVESDELELLDSFIFYSDRYDMEIVVPKGFICDGASIPSFMWAIFGHPFHSSTIRAAIIHDYLYRKKLISRFQADMIFYDGLSLTTNQLKATMMLLGVRSFGWRFY